jgi:hypothetical protein
LAERTCRYVADFRLTAVGDAPEHAARTSPPHRPRADRGHIRS